MRTRLTRLLTAVCGIAACVTTGSTLSAQQTPSPVVIVATSPQAIPPGVSSRLVLRGGGLNGAAQLWTGFSATTQLAGDVPGNGTNGAECTYLVNVPPETPVGIYGIRLATQDGISDTRLMMIDDLPSVPQVKPNQSSAAPQLLTLPVAVDGQLDNLARDYYRFTAAAGQRISVEVVARRLGSPLDPMIRLMDANGRELTYSDDAPGLGADSQVSYVIRDAGDYLLELRDIRYQGGGTHQYRLRIGDFPCVTTPYPLGVRRGSVTNLVFAGPQAADAAIVPVMAPQGPGINWLPVSVRVPNGLSSAFALLQVSDQDEVLESEPNNVAPQATRMNLGSAVNGRLESAGDVDRFQFTAKAGQRYTFTGITRTAGAPTDLFMRLARADGAELGSVDDTGAAEGTIDFTFPADGNYVLIVEDLHHRGGPDFAYRVISKPFTEELLLTASTDTINVPSGGTSTVTVTANRSLFGGPILVDLAGGVPGIVSDPAVIGPGRTSAVITVRSEATAPAGVIHIGQITGTATMATGLKKSAASLVDVQRVRLNGLPTPPPMLVDTVAFGKTTAPLYTLRAEPQTVVFGKNLAAKTKIIANRLEGFAGEIVLTVVPTPDGPLPNIGIAAGTIPAGANEVEVTINGNDQAPLGEYSVVLFGAGKLDNAPQPNRLIQAAPVITLKLQSPFDLQADMAAATITRGQTLTAKVRATRNPAYSGPVELTFQNLPAGVTAAPATIPEGQTEVDVVLTATAEAVVGPVGNIVVEGKGKVGEQPVSNLSPAAALTVN